MDLLLGNFVKKNINSFNDTELAILDNLMQIEDGILQKWYYRKNDENLVPTNKVSLLLKKFKL